MISGARLSLTCWKLARIFPWSSSLPGIATYRQRRAMIAGRSMPSAARRNCCTFHSRHAGRGVRFQAGCLAVSGERKKRKKKEKRCQDPLSAPLSRSEEHTSELQSHLNLVCRLLLEKKNSISILPLINSL